MIKKICIVGAGTMGRGIALAAAQSNFNVVLCDINEKVIEAAKASIINNLDFLVNKAKITFSEKEAIFHQILFTSVLNDCIGELILEAIVEKPEAKEGLFMRLAHINNPQTILASNTSSLSITTIQKNIPHPERVIGMHFFNPANIMKLVEVVKGISTSHETAKTVMNICVIMNKVPVLCNDAPGFIVNRVARHYYLEALHLVEQNIAPIETVDRIMEASGFKMGPFKLMDLIGMDINLAVSESIYHAFNNADRFKPSSIQIDKVAKGELGKKSGRGFYQY